ncbi:hypothetical protein RI844_00045 [Thalassotalea fonticola]|uniref:Uncharacterized protein n=1 Tax=Thalassotalea fonticola TaxID=3065649 RepID=A0ABZ0GPM7_9GAMM|nr:hypothetical protein RI844_20235 [Colwelliaceae bacterium S1-1]WOH37669.1 hypothetical protein RI844_00045 [Colwelliaceae bacterium S1-1]
MSSENFELSDGALRQRRNLMSVTLLVVFTHFAGVEFGEQVKFMGTSFKITNPNFIIQFILIIQAYFLWRFYQYFYHDKVTPALKFQYRNQLSSTQDKEILSQIFKKLPKGVQLISSSHTYSDIQKLDSSAGIYEVEVNSPNSDNSGDNKHLIEISRKSIEKKKFPVVFGFAFRGKIITDFYLPLIFVILSVPLNFV